MLTQQIPLDMSPGEVCPVIHVSQYDAGSRTLVFQLMSRDGEIVLQPGTQAEIRGTKPDGHGFSYEARVSGNTVTAELTEQMTAVAGRTVCEIALFTGTQPTTDTPASDDYTLLSTANFILSVESNTLDFDLIIVDEQATAPIIASDFRASSASQYQTLNIPYRVFTPNALSSQVTLWAGDTQVAALSVGRTEQVWSYRLFEAGETTLTIRSGMASLSFPIEVAEAEVDVEAETDSLALYLSSAGRSDSERNPDVWKDADRNIACTLSNFNFVSNGWVADEEGITVLRVSGDARVTIPYQPFARDFRGTGKTIEIEFATRDVLDYDAEIISCMSGGRGFRLTSQRATLRSEQREISTQYKENEHVRISFVAEKRSENRLLYIYINGVMSGVVQYPEDDDFSQSSPVNISVGHNGCATDIYCIRVYDNNLTRYQILDNWIADSQNIETLLARYEHNNVYDEYGKIVIEKLPKDLPYMVIEAAELPQYKGDKKTVSISYVDPVTPSRSFTASGVQINVQGTSSAPYARKNYDMQYKKGFTTPAGTVVSNYKLAPGVIPFNRFVLKADVASSEGANNVELVKLFCDACPYKRPEEIANPLVRKGIFGFPIVVFWRDTADDSLTLLGKYNFNLPKRAPEPYGYSGDMESWEFQNNTSDLMNFLTDYFDETMQADPTTGESKEKWRYDYEARFPEDTWTDYSKLQELHTFIISTYREQATGETLSEPYTDTDGNTHTVDNAAYRLAKFRTEFGNYAEVDSFIFYYIFTELFLMVDSRAKNLFIGFSGSDADPEICHAIDRKAVAEPYDMDTAIGTNNEGSLVFGYSYEDTDHLEGGADVFNGQNSVLWNNIRDAFPSEIVQMYQRLRSEGILSYASVEKRFEDHQAKWSEAIFNDDAQFKYLDPLVNPDPGKEPTDVYLPMLQGSKAEQRKWWLYNRFQYMDSKWNAGDALSDVIQLRGYAKADITVTPYADIYTTIKYGSYMVSGRGRHGVPQRLACPLDNVNDTEIYVYSASQLASVGDLSGLKVGFADFSNATKLQSIKVGSNEEGYTNGNLTGLNVGTNPLLGSVDARNCTALSGTVDLSGAANIEMVLFEGTALTACSLPNGGILKTLHLPGTVTNLTVRNQTITDFSMPDYSGISTIRLENTKGIPLGDVLAGADKLTRVRIVDMEWTCPTAAGFAAIIEKLKAAGGLDEAGGNTDSAVVTGVVRVSETVPASVLTDASAHFPELVVFSNGAATCIVRYRNYDGSLLYTQTVAYGANAEDPAGSLIPTPARPADGRTGYRFSGWDSDLTDIRSNLTISALFDTVPACLVRFLNWDESELYSVYIAEGLHCSDPVTTGLISRPTRPTTETTVYNYMGWDRSLLNITTDRTLTARYSEEVSLKVTFVNTDGTELYVMYVASGASVPNPVQAGFIPTPTRADDENYVYVWSGTMTNITQDTTITATYTGYQYYTATFNNADGSLLVAQRVMQNDAVVDPVENGSIPTPSLEFGEDWHYVYKGWDKALSAKMTANATYKAVYKTDKHFTVTFVDYDGTTVLDTQSILDEEDAVDPVTSGRIPVPLRASTAQYDYTWTGWNKTFTKIKADATVTATYSSQIRRYTVRFWEEQTLIDTVVVDYNIAALCSVTPVKSGVEDPENYVLATWSPVPTGITGDTDCYAIWDRITITDTWEQIFAAEADGTYSTKYAVGDTAKFVLGESETVVMQIVAMDTDDLADGSGKAKITWISKYLLQDLRAMNVTNNTNGGWGTSRMRSQLREQVYPAIPEVIRNAIKEVTKTYISLYPEALRTPTDIADTVWIPSAREVFGGASYPNPGESRGCVYTGFFSSASMRKKNKCGLGASSWWMRTAPNSSGAGYATYFACVTSSGSRSLIGAGSAQGVALGFCT